MLPTVRISTLHLPRLGSSTTGQATIGVLPPTLARCQSGTSGVYGWPGVFGSRTVQV